MANQLDINQVLTIIKTGKFDDLLGAVEGDQLECKKQHYRLDDNHAKFELAKDVSAFANAKGGTILIGVEAKPDNTVAADIIRKIRTFPKSQANISRYRDVLKDWIYPNLQKLDIEWFPSAAKSSEGIVAIIIGNQDQLWRPFVITRTVENSGKMSTVFFGYAERSLDRSAPMGIQQLHLLLRDGFRFESSVPAVSPPPPPQEPPPPVPASPPPKPPQSPPSSPSLLPGSSTGTKVGEELLQAQLHKRGSSAIEAVQLSASPVFVLVAAPYQSTEIQGLFSSRDSDVVRLLEHPPELRRSGFGPDAGYNSRIVEGGEARRTMIERYKLLQIWNDGWIVFVADGGADFLCWGNKLTDRLRVNQLALIEATYLFVRFTNEVLTKAEPSPETVRYWLMLRRMTVQQPAILFPGPLTTFPHGEQEAQGSDKDVTFVATFGTDPCLIAFKLVAQVYRWFGFDETDIPYTEETTSGTRIISPDQIIDQNRRIIG